MVFLACVIPQAMPQFANAKRAYERWIQEFRCVYRNNRSCWAFSSIAAIEGILQIKTHKLVEFSRQELVDCDALSSGCTTGRVAYTFQYVMKNGVRAGKNYVYKGQAGKCDDKGKTRSAKIKGYPKVGDGKHNLLQVLAQQPITLGLLFWQSFKSYKSGIFGNLPIKETMDISH
ncbi:caricain-like [Lathyrus oleraceus]|uniref:caricain-like n=1 Tax=Pisum sativum TaxID=3888 RepID=UPI0021CF6D7F|nr:caricain-like [Pisum sativum]